MKKFAVLTIAVLLVSGCGGRNYMAEREFYKATQVLREIDGSQGPQALNPAIEAFQQVVDKYPGTPKAVESLELISNMRLKQKEYAEARKAMKGIIESFSTSRSKVADARYRMGQIFELEGDWKSAEKTFWELAEYSPLHVKGLYAPIRILLHYKGAGDERALEKQYVKALDHYESLVKQVGAIDAVAPVKNYLAMAYLVTGKMDKAVEEWTSIHEQFPKNPYAPMALLAAAEVLWKNGETERAEQLYGTFFKDYPGHQMAGKTALNLAMQYQGRRNFDKARTWYRKALTEYFPQKSAKHAEIKLLMAKTYQDEVLWEEAEEIYSEIEDEYADTSAALQVPLLRARYFSDTGEKETSGRILDEAIARYKNIEVEADDERGAKFAQRFRSAALAQKGAWDELVAEVRANYEQESNPDKKGRWLFLEALLTENRLKKNEEARALYQRFLKDYPGHPLAPRAEKQLNDLQAVPAAS